MQNYCKATLLYVLVSLCIPVLAQRPQAKFGDIKPSDFSPSSYSIDSSASGVVLFDFGSTKYEGNSHGSFSIVFKRHTRIRLLNRNSFDLASISIPMYASGGNEEKIETLEATTYNLENGKVVSYKLDKASIFKDRLNKNYTVRKFTLPNLQEGCIIEIKYNFISPYPGDVRSWYFQGNYPVLWSEYQVSIPTIFEFTRINQGYQPFAVNDTKVGSETYTILDPGATASQSSETFNFRSPTVEATWAMKNVPALKKEAFTTTIDNHISKMDFQLSKVRYPNSPEKDVMNNWFKVSEELLKDPDFGEALAKGNGWSQDELKKITAGTKTPLEAAKKIYAFVRDNMSCTNHSAKYLSSPLKKTFQTKNGNVADINLLLTALLINQGLEAKPVLLSTRDHGKAIESYPVMDQLNYVITQIKIDDQQYLLDASQSRLGFGKLSAECYNGYARIIDKDAPYLIDLSADSIREKKLTTVFIVNNEKGGLAGTFTSSLGEFETASLREKLANKTEEEYFKELKKNFSFDIKMRNTAIDSLKNYEQPISVKYDFQFDVDEDVIYLNPIIGEAYKENPFKAAERYYPVEMPCALTETFILKMDVPKGYKIEELPKSSRVKLNDSEGMFEYLVSNEEGAIQLRSTVSLNKATFLPEDYEGLRDFFGYIVKKHSEQIVLKKIN